MNAFSKKEIMMENFAQSTVQSIVMMTKLIAQDKEMKWDASNQILVSQEPSKPKEATKEVYAPAGAHPSVHMDKSNAQAW